MWQSKCYFGVYFFHIAVFKMVHISHRAYMHSIPYSGKLSREKTFENFVAICGGFSIKFGGMVSLIGSTNEQSTKIFSMKTFNFQLFVKVFCYTVDRSVIPYSRKLLRGFKFGKFANFLLYAKHASATCVIARIIVLNGVVCGAHVFAKLKFTNNILRPIRQL